MLSVQFDGYTKVMVAGKIADQKINRDTQFAIGIRLFSGETTCILNSAIFNLSTSCQQDTFDAEFRIHRVNRPKNLEKE